MNKYDLELLNKLQKINIIIWIMFNNKKFKLFNNLLLIGMSSRAAYNKCKNYDKRKSKRIK